jgi:hypothetical protein
MPAAAFTYEVDRRVYSVEGRLDRPTKSADASYSSKNYPR